MSEGKLLEQGDVIEVTNDWGLAPLPGPAYHNGIAEIAKVSNSPLPSVAPFEAQAVIFRDGYVLPRIPEKILTEMIAAGHALTIGQRFLVVETKITGGSPAGDTGPDAGYPDGHHVQAVELSESHEIKAGGLTVEFYQTGCFLAQHPSPKLVGHKPLNYAPFLPAGEPS